jgi:hypothetical protein
MSALLWLAMAVNAAQLPYAVVGTGQTLCYGPFGVIPPPAPGQPYYGQDAQSPGPAPTYKDNGDGTVSDLVTGLMWQKTPPVNHGAWAEAVAYAKTFTLAGYRDWRLPTIKELFSLANLTGNIRTRTPYLDTRFFDFYYPDTNQGWRDIDSQYWSCNKYVGTTMYGDVSAFGYNFADGRIKAYPTGEGGHGPTARHYVRLVRGNLAYGQNDFVDNRDGTVTDRATGLTWQQADDGQGRDWPTALAYCAGLDLAGHRDWRLPNVKELQTLVDYTHAPDATDPQFRGPAIDTRHFKVSSPELWFWSSTTHVENGGAFYVSFGQGSAYDQRTRQFTLDAHGAGSMRSDPKTGDPRQWPQGFGPQGDQLRIYNAVRAVRGGR